MDYPFVTLDQVVANSATLIKDTDPRNRNLLRQWSYLAERQLGFSGLHIQAKSIDVDNLYIKKPNDYAIGIDLAIFDSLDNEYKYHFRGFGKRIHNEWTPSSDYEIGISEDPHYFYLDSTGSSIVKANLEYYSYPLDEHGDILIPEHHMFAIMQFNYWLWEKRKGENQSAIDQAKADWREEKVQAKSKNKVPSMLEGKDLVRFHNSMIDKIFYNKF
jgi:hypothetical protein